MTVELVAGGFVALMPIYVLLFNMNRSLGSVCAKVEANDARIRQIQEND